LDGEINFVKSVGNLFVRRCYILVCIHIFIHTYKRLGVPAVYTSAPPDRRRRRQYEEETKSFGPVGLPIVYVFVTTLLLNGPRPDKRNIILIHRRKLETEFIYFVGRVTKHTRTRTLPTPGFATLGVYRSIKKYPPPPPPPRRPAYVV